MFYGLFPFFPYGNLPWNPDQRIRGIILKVPSGYPPKKTRHFWGGFIGFFMGLSWDFIKKKSWGNSATVPLGIPPEDPVNIPLKNSKTVIR